MKTDYKIVEVRYDDGCVEYNIQAYDFLFGFIPILTYEYDITFTSMPDAKRYIQSILDESVVVSEKVVETITVK